MPFNSDYHVEQSATTHVTLDKNTDLLTAIIAAPANVTLPLAADCKGDKAKKTVINDTTSVSTLSFVAAGSDTIVGISASGAGDGAVLESDGSAKWFIVRGSSGVGATVSEAELVLADNTTADATSGHHGYMPKLTPGVATASQPVTLGADKNLDTLALDALTGHDASFGITGLAAAQGGAIAITGGTSSTAANAGGAVDVLGGPGGATGIGGAVSLKGGAGLGGAVGGAADVAAGAGQGTGNGAIASLTGGASGAGATGDGGVAKTVGGAATSTNGVGGKAQLTGGVGKGNQAGGTADVAGGAGGATGAGGQVNITSGAGGATSGVSGNLVIATGTTTAGSGSATGNVTVQSGAGANSAAAVAGGASGTVTLRSQAGGANTGAATGEAGGAGGLLSITGGNGGATNGQGVNAGGAGAGVTITGGTGGNATAGTGAGGKGGTIALVPGGGGTSSGGLAGIEGVVRVGSTFSKKTVVTAMTTTAAITVAALRGGLITASQGASGAATYTLPTGTEMDAAMPTDFVAGDSFDFSICNISTDAAEDVTVAGAAGMVAKGNLSVPSNDGVTSISFATFRVVKEAANTYSFYRV